MHPCWTYEGSQIYLKHVSSQKHTHISSSYILYSILTYQQVSSAVYQLTSPSAVMLFAKCQQPLQFANNWGTYLKKCSSYMTSIYKWGKCRSRVKVQHTSDMDEYNIELSHRLQTKSVDKYHSGCRRSTTYNSAAQYIHIRYVRGCTHINKQADLNAHWHTHFTEHRHFIVIQTHTETNQTTPE